MAHVFISYSRKDIDFAELLLRELADAGIYAWLDRARLRAGDDWRQEIDDAITNACAIIVILTPSAKQSLYVTYEWSYALGAKKLIIPVMRDKTKPHSRLNAIQYLDFTGDDRPWQKLVSQIEDLKECNPARDFVPKTASRSIKRIASGINSADSNERIQAINQMAQVNDPIAREILARLLQHTDKDIRITSALELAQVSNNKDTRALSGLIEALNSDNSNVRARAAWSLGPIGGIGAIPELMRALHDKDSSVRSHAAGALGEIADSSVVPELIKLLSDSADFQSLEGQLYSNITVASVAAEALKKIGTPKALTAVEAWKQEQEGKAT